MGWDRANVVTADAAEASHSQAVATLPTIRSAGFFIVEKGTMRMSRLAGVSMRRARAEDAGAVRDLTRAAYAKWIPVIGREPKPMTADYGAAVRAHLIDLLHADGHLAALIEMIHAPDHLLIENVAVSPNFQGRGFGRILMAHAEQVAVSLGHGEVRLYTNKMFAENVVLYGRLGYLVDREGTSERGVTVYMTKRLSGRG
jgi:GNAT superfamily N-acetyltransferase